MPQPTTGWGANDTPVAANSGGWGASDEPVPVGIRAQTPWEGIKSRFQQFVHDPVGTLTSPIPGTENMQGQGDPLSQFMLAGASASSPRVGAALKAAVAPKAGGRLAKVIDAFKSAGQPAEEAAAATPKPTPAPTSPAPPAADPAFNVRTAKFNDVPGASQNSTTSATTTADTPTPAPTTSKYAQAHAERIQGQIDARDQAIINHLKGSNITPDAFEKMTPADQSAELNKLNAKTGKKYAFRFDRGDQGAQSVKRVLDTWRGK